MKKVISIFLIVWMMLSAMPSAMCSDLPIMVKIDGVAITGTENAYIDGETVMVPLRTVSQALGSEVTWLEEAKSALVTFMDGRAIVPGYGNNFYIDDKATALKKDIVIKNGTTFVSSDYINLFYDYVTQWNGLARILTIKPGESYQDSIATETEEDKGYIDVVATQDAYVKNGSFAGQNFGSAAALEYKAETLADYGRIIYLKFDLSRIKDPEFISADLQLTAYSCEAGAKISPVVYNLSETDTNWKETEITYNNRPAATEKVGQFNEIYNPLTEFELTDYIKKKISEGVKEISFVLDGDYSQKLRVDFYSKEKADQLPPRLRITYVESDSFVKELPKKENFSEDTDPWEWAQTMIAQSTAERTKISEDGLVKQTTQNKFEISAAETTYTNSGNLANKNFAESQTIVIKGDPATTNTGRVSYLKFDLSQADFETVDYAYIKLYCTALDAGNGHKLALYEVTGDWSADKVTWNNSPAKGRLVSKGEAVKTSDWIFLDATEYLKECAAKGKKTGIQHLWRKSGYERRSHR